MQLRYTNHFSYLHTTPSAPAASADHQQSNIMSLTLSNLEAHNFANKYLTPSTTHRNPSSRGTPSDEYAPRPSSTRASLTQASSSTSSSSRDRISRSLDTVRKQWRDHIWAHRTDRLERILLGHVAVGSKVLTIDEMEDEMPWIPEVRRGFADCLPVASLEGAAFVGWRAKGATFPRMGDA